MLSVLIALLIVGALSFVCVVGWFGIAAYVIGSREQNKDRQDADEISR